MKHLSFLIILAWSLFILITKPDIKPSEGILLYILSCVSIMYSVINIIIYIHERNNYK